MTLQAKLRAMNAPMRRRTLLSNRLKRILDALELQEVKGLARYSQRDIRCLPTVGTLTIQYIERKLKAEGLTLREYEPGTKIPKEILAAVRKLKPD